MPKTTESTFALGQKESAHGQYSARTYLNCNMDIIMEDGESQNTYSEKRSVSSRGNHEQSKQSIFKDSTSSQKDSKNIGVSKPVKRSSSRRFVEDDLLGFNQSGVIYVQVEHSTHSVKTLDQLYSKSSSGTRQS